MALMNGIFMNGMTAASKTACNGIFTNGIGMNGICIEIVRAGNRVPLNGAIFRMHATCFDVAHRSVRTRVGWTWIHTK